MKKSLLFLSAVSLVLAGCSFSSPSSEVVSDTSETGTSTVITGSVENSGDSSVGQTTATMIQAGLQLTTTPTVYTDNNISIGASDYKKYQSQIKDCVSIEDGGETSYICKEMKGYAHTYYAPALGIKISDKFSFDKDSKIFGLDGNKLYLIEHPEAFILMIAKDQRETPEKIIKNRPVPKGCVYDTGYISPEDDSFVSYSLINQEGCTMWGEDETETRYYFNTNKKDYYYQENNFSDSAGGPNLKYGDREYFLK